eukprot:c28705_g1_i1.p2 GENE.c28705_g1_i1~~c28705_g1_i1.p2  ORF type:complete len:103 (-),score=19.19 c28705_g1_i1:79-342(-)
MDTSPASADSSFLSVSSAAPASRRIASSSRSIGRHDSCSHLPHTGTDKSPFAPQKFTPSVARTPAVDRSSTPIGTDEDAATPMRLMF